MIKKLLILSTFAVFTAGAQAATLLVDNDLAQCPGAQYTSIQAAVNAANQNDTIRVCPGTYPEQVTINKNLKVEGFEVANENLAVIQPATVVANSTSLTTGSPIAAIVLVTGASNVAFTNIAVDGIDNNINGCAPNLIGIYYRNASGQLNSVAVRNIKLGPGLEGCQSGLGVFAQSGAGGSSKLEVKNSSVHDYQKNGITGNEVGTELTVKGNAITGIGPTPDIAQNGVQIGNGAKGTIEDNAILNHVYSLCTDAENCGAVSTNILVFDSGAVKIKGNAVGKSQVNIYLQTNGGEVSDNTILDTDVFDGVFVFGNNNKVDKNFIFNSDEAGVYVQGNDNKIEKNTINEAPVGVFLSGTNNTAKGNTFFNTNMNVVIDAPAPAERTGPSNGRAPAISLP